MDAFDRWYEDTFTDEFRGYVDADETHERAFFTKFDLKLAFNRGQLGLLLDAEE